MQTITVKVCYKGKTLIVGKGIGSVEEIFKELAKRFPEVEQIKSSLNVGFQNGAQDLMSAYKLAEKENRRFIKVKFASEDQMDRSFISERTQDSCVISVIDPSEERQKIPDFTKPQQSKPDESKKEELKEEPKQEAFQNLEERYEISAQKAVQNIEIPSRKSSFAEEVKEPERAQEVSEEPKPEIPVTEEVKLGVSEIKTASEKQEHQIDYGLLDDYFPSEKQQKEKNDKRAAFEALFGVSEKKEEKVEQPLSPMAQRILNIVKRQYDVKITTLETQYDDLKSKYNILYKKCAHLEEVCGIGSQAKQAEIEAEHKRKSTQEIKNVEGLFQKLWKESVPQQKQNDQKIKNLQPVQHFAEITEYSTLETAQVGDLVQSTFRFKNVGIKNWPENVFAQEQDSQEFIDVKSLAPNESSIVTLRTIKAEKAGEKINKMYQLVYFDEDNNMRKFGRIFGISVKVVEKKFIDPLFKPKPNVHNPDSSNRRNIEFRNHIHDIMVKNKLVSKSLYDVIAALKEFEITDENFKNCDPKTLTEFIRSICH